MDEHLEDCGAEIVHYTSRVTLRELPHGPLPGDVAERMARQFERSLDLRMCYLMGEFEPPTNFPFRRRHGAYFDLTVMS